MSDTGQKYRDKVTPEFELSMQAIGMSRNFLQRSRKEYEALVESAERIHSVGIVIDPTLYRDTLYSQQYKDNLALTKAALDFLKATDEIFARMQAEMRKAEA